MASYLLQSTEGIPEDVPCEFDYKLTDEYFNTPSVDETTKSVTSEMPDGQYWEAKLLNGTMMRALMFASSELFRLFLLLIQTLGAEFNLYTTNALIHIWERSVGLPDPRLGTTNLTLCDRRKAVLRRLDKTPVVTLVQMQNLIDQQFPDFGIWLSTGASGETFRYSFRYTLGPGEGVRSSFVIDVHIPWLAMSNPPQDSDPLTIDNLFSWFQDFIPSYVLLNPIYEDQASYCIITEPQDEQPVRAISDGAGDYDDISVYWKQIDIDGTVTNHLDMEDIQPTQTEITRDFTDSDSVLIIATNSVKVITLL